MTTEFDLCIHKSTTSDERYHKQSRSSQVNFAQQVQGMVKVIEESCFLLSEAYITNGSCQADSHYKLQMAMKFCAFLHKTPIV